MARARIRLREDRTGTDVRLRATDLPMALREMHLALDVGEPVEVTLAVDEGQRSGTVSSALLADVAEGAGLAHATVEERPVAHRESTLIVRATRARTLADTVGPRMRVLVCGLNPSLTAADAGVGFYTAGNRFWPAALAAGLVTRDRDPQHALSEHGLGMTDLVKRATPRADGLTAAEYRAGVDRLERLCAWLRPGVVCFVGLAGWRAAVDRRATAGPQATTLGGSPVYLAPSTSGANASSQLPDLIEHLRRALALPAST